VEMKMKLYFYGAANQNGYRVGSLLIVPDESHNPIAIKLNFAGTNNTTAQNMKHVSMD